MSPETSVEPSFRNAPDFDLPPCVARACANSKYFIMDRYGTIHLPAPRRTIPREKQENYPPRAEFLFEQQDIADIRSLLQATSMDSHTIHRDPYSDFRLAPINADAFADDVFEKYTNMSID